MRHHFSLTPKIMHGVRSQDKIMDLPDKLGGVSFVGYLLQIQLRF